MAEPNSDGKIEHGRESHAPVFDPSALDDLLAIGDGTLVRRLLEQFEADHHATVRRLGEAISAGEWDRVRRDAHTLKSSSRFVGLHEVGGLAEDIELRARASTGDPRLHAALVDAMARGVAAFRAFVATAGSSHTIAHA